MAPTTMPEQKTETNPYGWDPVRTGYLMQGPEMIAAITKKKPWHLMPRLLSSARNTLAQRGRGQPSTFFQCNAVVKIAP